MFVSSLINSQHVSGITLPIIRRTRLFNTACGDAWSHDHSQHNQASPRAVLNSLVLLMMGKMMPETC
jgi:hypothetical protein